jgi:hypothetical protein
MLAICAELKFSLIVDYVELDQDSVWAKSPCCVGKTDIKEVVFSS